MKLNIKQSSALHYLKGTCLWVFICFFLFFIINAHAITFRIHGSSHIYTEREYPGFIVHLQNIFLHHEARDTLRIFISDQNSHELELELNPANLYITHINGLQVRNPNYVYNQNQQISRATIENAIINSNRDQESTLRVIAFITSEAARFSSIRSTSNNILNGVNDNAYWADYLEMMHNWQNTSRNIQRLITSGQLRTNVPQGRDHFYIGISRYLFQRYLYLNGLAVLHHS